jgi:hypothetical protein
LFVGLVDTSICNALRVAASPMQTVKTNANMQKKFLI